MKHSILPIIMALLLAFPASGFARDWHVAPGAAADTAGTAEKPTELFSALARVAAGDTILLAGGRYELTRQIFLKKDRLTLKNAGPERPVLVLPSDDRKLSSVIWPYASGCTIQGLEIIGGWSHGVKIDYPAATVIDCIIHGSGRDCIKIAAKGHDTRIENCELYGNGHNTPNNAEGIDNVGCDRVIVRNCYIHDVPTNGIYMKGGASDCLIEGNVVTDCGDNGIMLGQSTDANLIRRPPYECVDSIARNNFVARCRGAGLAFEAAFACLFEKNVVYNTGLRTHGGFSVHANQHGTPSKNITFTDNTVIILTGRPVVAVHRGALESAKDLVSDRNRYFYPGRDATFAWDNDDFTGNIDAWRAKTGLDISSTLAGPGVTLDLKQPLEANVSK